MLKREVETVGGKERVKWRELRYGFLLSEAGADIAEAAYRMGFNDGCAKGIADSAAYEARRDG